MKEDRLLVVTKVLSNPNSWDKANKTRQDGTLTLPLCKFLNIMWIITSLGHKQHGPLHKAFCIHPDQQPSRMLFTLKQRIRKKLDHKQTTPATGPTLWGRARDWDFVPGCAAISLRLKDCTNSIGRKQITSQEIHNWHKCWQQQGFGELHRILVHTA